jgi:hypothetical protein
LRQRMPAFEQHTSLRYVFAPTERGRTRLDVDFSKLAADSQLQESLALVAGGHFQLLQIRQRTQKDAEIMCVELGRFVGQACNLHRPVPTF